MFDFDRRKALIAGVFSAAALALGACNGAGGGAGGAPAEGEMAMGSEDAPVTVVEYASVTCGHCAAWSQEVWPEFKSRYIDTGQVRFVFRELPTPPQQIAVAGFLLARCAGEDRYFAMVESMMRNQQAMIANPRGELLNLARTAGMNEEQFDQCVTDQAAVDALNQRVEAANAAGVTGTPYFLINGERHQDITLDGFEAALRPLIGGEAPASASTPAQKTQPLTLRTKPRLRPKAPKRLPRADPLIRRSLLALIALAWLPLAATSAAQSRDVQPGDMVLGRAGAPVTVVEYASVTCGHCAAWHTEVFPEFKRRFIDTGRVRLVFRELPTPPVELASAGFILARCAGPEGYFGVVGDLMREQRQVFAAPLERLIAIGARHGVTEAEFRVCLNDPAQTEGLNARVEHALGRGVNATPTFFVNGRQVAVGEAPIATLEAAIRQAEG